MLDSLNKLNAMTAERLGDPETRDTDCPVRNGLPNADERAGVG